MQIKSVMAVIFALSMTSAAIADTAEIIDANGALKMAPADKNASALSGGGAAGGQDLNTQIQSLSPDVQQKILALPPEQQKAILKAMKGMGSSLPGQGQQQPPKPTFQQQTITPPQNEQMPLPPGASAASELDSPSSSSDSSDESNRNASPNTALSAPATGKEGEMMGQPGP